MLLQNISAKTLGRLVLDAVESSVDQETDEIQVFKFLNNLYISARDYERLSTESQIHFALREVEAHSKTLAKIEQHTIHFKEIEHSHEQLLKGRGNSPRKQHTLRGEPKTSSRKASGVKETFL